MRTGVTLYSLSTGLTTPDEVQALVDDELSQWILPTVEPGSTVGTPWGEERYRVETGILRAALVAPRLQRFRFAETYEHAIAIDKPSATYWVVAVVDRTILWYDDTAGEFGLGQFEPEPSLPTSIRSAGGFGGKFLCALTRYDHIVLPRMPFRRRHLTHRAGELPVCL